jgi:trk system potassium uptake protein TrkH
MRTVGRILSFFFLVMVTMFICAAILSFTGPTFSEAVSMSIACLSTVGNLPGLLDSTDFTTLTPFGKVFCMIILVIGRLEIFALLIAIAGIKIRRRKSDW